MSFRLPLVDAPPLDVPAVVEGARPSHASCVAIVPIRDVEPALAFAVHVVRAARVAGARPTVVVSERVESGAEVEPARGSLRARFVEAGASHVLIVRSDATRAAEVVRGTLVAAAGFVVAISTDVAAATRPGFTIAITSGRALTTWTAMARGVRAALDAELVEVRSEVARGLVSAFDREGLLGPKSE